MKVGIYTLGCKVNTYESEYIMSLLKKNNYELSSFDDVCDIYIINTCTVTNTSDIKSRKIIRSAKRKNPKALVIAIGCFVQANSDIEIEGADILLGNKDKSKIVDYIEMYFQKQEKICQVYDDLGVQFEDMYIDQFMMQTRAFVKIQDGCENFCSYCIIPYVRGKCRSKKMETVVDEVEHLVKNGFYEIVLTGIHTGNYGRDINTNLSALLKELVSIQGLKRLRISSIEVTELNDEILDLIQNHKEIVNHFHIPIQAASDAVLTTMNRKYDLDYFQNKIKKLREIKSDVSITTDLIVGHPGEDDETFAQSLKVLKEIGFSKIHVFPYSKREGTKSSTMIQIDDKTKKERVGILLKLSKELEINYMNNFLNREVEVLIERTKDGYSYGHTTNYLQIKVKGVIKHNEFATIKIIAIQYPFCLGEVVACQNV